MDVARPIPDPELAELADVVWVERTVTEHLAFKLAALELVLTADLRRYVGRCLDEVDDAWDQLERAEVRRAAALDAVAVAWGRPPSSLRLRDLTDGPEPWATVFSDHRDHLRLLLAEVRRTTAENARLCAATLAHVDRDLGLLAQASRRSLDLWDAAGSVRAPLRLVPTGEVVGREAGA